jgi:hypothetical protein
MSDSWNARKIEFIHASIAILEGLDQLYMNISQCNAQIVLLYPPGKIRAIVPASVLDRTTSGCYILYIDKMGTYSLTVRTGEQSSHLLTKSVSGKMM